MPSLFTQTAEEHQRIKSHFVRYHFFQAVKRALEKHPQVQQIFFQYTHWDHPHDYVLIEEQNPDQQNLFSNTLQEELGCLNLDNTQCEIAAKGVLRDFLNPDHRGVLDRQSILDGIDAFYDMSIVRMDDTFQAHLDRHCLSNTTQRAPTKTSSYRL
jgi:hypothetical protein